MAISLGIYWIFFIAHGGHQLRLQVDARTQEEATKLAKAKAARMGFGWVYDSTETCR